MIYDCFKVVVWSGNVREVIRCLGRVVKYVWFSIFSFGFIRFCGYFVRRDSV